MAKPTAQFNLDYEMEQFFIRLPYYINENDTFFQRAKDQNNTFNDFELFEKELRKDFEIIVKLLNDEIKEAYGIEVEYQIDDEIFNSHIKKDYDKFLKDPKYRNGIALLMFYLYVKDLYIKEEIIKYDISRFL